MKASLIRLVLCVALASFIVGCAGMATPSRHNALDYTKYDAAVEGGDFVTVKALTNEDRRIVNGRGWGDTTPLILAAQNDQTEIAQFLVQSGADLNATAKGGATALHLAAQRNNRALAELLLAHKAKINAADAQGRTPTDRAIEWHHPDMAAFLRSQGGKSLKH
ncbi:MAG: ankyrin repeat domain-containing protein [Chthoniobacterales bacterium]